MKIFSLRPDRPNVGNGLIALGADAMLRSAFGNSVSLINIPLHPNGNLKGGGLTAQTVYEINQLADGVIIGPGNLFENGALTVDLNALSALSVPLAIFSASMGRVFDRKGQLALRTDSMATRIISTLCQMADPILVRDRATMEYLTGQGIARVCTIGCPTLFLGDATLPLAPPEPALAESVLISLRNPALMSVPYSFHGRVYQDIRRMIDAFRSLGMDVHLVCHDYQDLRFAQAFPDTPALYTEDPVRFLSWLQGGKLNIGFRLHAFVCSAGLGVPSIPLTYDERSMSLIETIGLSDWAIPYLHTNDLMTDVFHRYQNLPRFLERTREVRDVWNCLRQGAVNGLASFGKRMNAQASHRVF